MPGLVDLYNGRRSVYQLLKPFLRNPDLADNEAYQQLRRHLNILPEYLQIYTLDKLHTPLSPFTHEKLVNLLKDAGSTGGLRLSGEDAYGLQLLFSKLTTNLQWEVGNIQEALDDTSAKLLKSMVTVYNHLCIIKGCNLHKIKVNELKHFGGNKRIIWLMFSFSGSAQLIQQDFLEVERLESEERFAPNPAPWLHPPASVGPRPNPSSNRSKPAAVAAAITPQYVESFVFKFSAVDCESPPRPRQLSRPARDGSPDVMLEGEDGTRVFSPICAICNESLRTERSLPRFVKCTHVSTFHLSCYAIYIAHWMNSKSYSKPKVPRCPVYGCGWSYTSVQMVTFKCSNKIFLPDEPIQPTPDQGVMSSSPNPGIYIVDD